MLQVRVGARFSWLAVALTVSVYVGMPLPTLFLAAAAASNDVESLAKENMRRGRAEKGALRHCLSFSQMRCHVQDEKNVLAALSKLDLDSLRITPNIPDNADQAVQLVVTENLKAYLPLAGLVDIDKEVERLTKQANKLQSEYDGNIKRLSSSKFVDKAPPEIVQGVRDKVSEAEEKLQIVKQRLARLDSMALSSRS